MFMIAFISGTLIMVHMPNTMIIETHGVGYELQVDYALLNPLPELHSALSVHIQQIVREDALNLYAFKSIESKRLFNELTKISGVGPKMAMNLLSQVSDHQLLKSIGSDDLTVFKAIRGIGSKVAQRILLELKPKLIHFDAPNLATPHTNLTQEKITELEQTLIKLGYKESQFHQWLKKLVLDSPKDDLSQLIKKSLQYF
jgi:holliday junction DNA helicase RuvA